MNESFFKYLEFEKRYSTHTIRAYRDDLTQFLFFLKHQFELDKVLNASHTHVRSWIVHMMQNDITPRTINRKISTLKSYFKYLKKKGLVESNPMSKIISPKTKKRLPGFIREKHVENLETYLSADVSFSGVRDALMISMLYELGIRRSELIQMKASDIDFSLKHIKILGKGKKERVVPISEKTLSNIQSFLKLREESFEFLPEELFITDSGKKLYPKFVYNLCVKYLRAVSPNEYVGPHVLRHSFATHLANNGADLNAIKELLGHSSLAATQVYMHNSIEKLKEVYQKSHPKASSK